MKTIHIIIALFLCSAAQPASALSQEAFFEKINPIKKHLFHYFPDQLCQLLGIPQPEINIITAPQLKELQAQSTNLLVVNVLTANYYHDCHIKSSINAPLPKLVDIAQNWDKKSKIVVYCAFDECDAGEKGTILLSCMGFKDVADYRGGIKEWFQLGYPTNGPAESEYLHVRSMQDECMLYPELLVCSRQTRWLTP